MTKYNGSINNLLQGVSQQARRDRRPEQVGEQTNCYSSITKGLGKRPGTIAKIDALDMPGFADAAKHTYDRGDGTERYTLVLGSTLFQAVDLLTGVLKGVSYATTYLQDFTGTGKLPKDYLRFFTIADTTLLVNTTATPVMMNPSDAEGFQIVIHIVQANYGLTYKVTIDGVVISSYTTPTHVDVDLTDPANTEATKSITLKTSDIMDKLWNTPTLGVGIESWATTNGVTATHDDDVIVLSKSSGDYRVDVYDDAYNKDLKAIGAVHDVYRDLPKKCLHDYKVKITGTDREVENDYYVEFVHDTGNTTNIGKGHWKECIGFDVNQSFDPTTMPYKITRNPSGSFTLAENVWIDRSSGDYESNPEPSFIDLNINSIATYQDRLVLLSEENTIASVTFDHFNLFSESVIQSSADDPIDTASSDNQVTNLEHILIFDSSLMIFSNKAQFIHSGEKAFTSDVFALSSKTRYSTDVTSAPVASASSVFFPYKFGPFTGVREYRMAALTGVVAAEAVTHHVKQYIPGDCLQIESSTDYDLLLVRVSGDTNAVYVYEWFDQGDTRKQAAWHRWEFSTDIEHINIIQDTLYIWSKRDGDDVTCVTLDLADRNTENIAFPLRLDNHIELLATDYAGTHWKLTRDLSELGDTWDNVQVVGGENSGIEGAATDWEPIGDDSGVLIDKLAVPNPTGTPYFYIGAKYNGKVELTNPYVRDNQGNPKTSAKTTLKTMKFNLADTGYIKATVTKVNSPTFVKEYNSKIIGSEAYNLNSAAPLQDDSLKVPIRSDASRCIITLESDSHLPFYVLDIDWSCNYKERGRRTI